MASVVFLGPGEGEHLPVGGSRRRHEGDRQVDGRHSLRVRVDDRAGLSRPTAARPRDAARHVLRARGHADVPSRQTERQRPCRAPLSASRRVPLHTFSNPSAEPVRFLNLNTPAGFEDYMRDLSARSRPGGRRRRRRSANRARHDVERRLPAPVTVTDSLTFRSRSRHTPRATRAPDRRYAKAGGGTGWPRRFFGSARASGPSADTRLREPAAASLVEEDDSVLARLEHHVEVPAPDGVTRPPPLGHSPLLAHARHRHTVHRRRYLVARRPDDDRTRLVQSSRGTSSARVSGTRDHGATSTTVQTASIPVPTRTWRKPSFNRSRRRAPRGRSSSS